MRTEEECIESGRWWKYRRMLRVTKGIEARGRCIESWKVSKSDKELELRVLKVSLSPEWRISENKKLYRSDLWEVLKYLELLSGDDFSARLRGYKESLVISIRYFRFSNFVWNLFNFFFFLSLYRIVMIMIL